MPEAGSPTKKQVVVHPLLFSWYPIAFLYVVNYDFFEFSVVLRSTLVSGLLTAGAWWLASRVFSDRKRTAIAVSALFLGLVSFGPFHGYFGEGRHGVQIGNQIAIVVFVTALVCVGFCLNPHFQFDV